MSLRIAYLINLYPAVSHTFIRREMQALERQGVVVDRIALRGWDTPVVDAADVAERGRTRYVLGVGFGGLLAALLRSLVTAPGRTLSALRLALRMAQDSERGVPTHLAYLAEACVIARWLTESGASHLHAHFATNPAEIAMLVRALGGPPYSFTAHGSDIMNRPAQVGLPLTVGHAAFVACVCSYGRSQVFRWVPHDLWSRVRVVRCGLDPDYARATPAAPAASRRLLCVGRLSDEKGQLLLVEAASRLIASGIRDVEVVLAGDGPLRGEIEALIERRGIGAAVRIAGWLDAKGISAEMQQARALVVPSLSEGLPVVIMEAMAHRLPVIAPFLAGIPELVQDGTTGWLFPASDTERLCDAMANCLQHDPAHLAEMGRAAEHLVRQLHDVDAEASELIRLFEPPAKITENPAQP